MMPRRFLATMVVCLVCVGSAFAQFYPRGFGGRGWGGWGTYGRDPGADYLRGAGYYQRAKGDYDIDEAKASKLKAEAFAEWNKVLRQAKQAKRREETEKAAEEAVEDRIAATTYKIESGATLNTQIDHLMDFPTEATFESLNAQPLSADALRDIPFENASEPISYCLDILTQEDGWPAVLTREEFVEPRQRFAEAVDQALKEDLSGEISDETRKKLDAAVADLKAALKKVEEFPTTNANEADAFLRTLAGMIRLLESPKGQAITRQIETFDGGTLADLVGFMKAYNLRFGRASSDRQKRIYYQLHEQFKAIPKAGADPAAEATASIVDHSRELGDAAKAIFSNLSWDEINKAAEASEPGADDSGSNEAERP